MDRDIPREQSDEDHITDSLSSDVNTVPSTVLGSSDQDQTQIEIPVMRWASFNGILVS